MSKINYDGLVNAVVNKKSSLPILRCVAVKNGVMTAAGGVMTDTGLDIFLYVDTDFADGIYEYAAKRWVKRDFEIEDFPMLPEFNLETSVMLPTKPIIDAYNFTTKDETRPVFMNVFAGVNEDTKAFDIVATDGHRLFKRNMPIANCFNHGSLHLLIPRKVIELIKKSKVDEVEYGYSTTREVTKGEGYDDIISYSNTHGMIRFSGVTIIFRVCQEMFPHYNNVIPSRELTRMMQFKTADMLKVLKELTPIAKAGNGIASVFMTDNELHVGSRSDAEDVEEVLTIPCTFGESGILNTDNVAVVMPVNYEGETLSKAPKNANDEAHFNIRYLTELLSVLGEDTYCYYENSLKPFVFHDNNIITGPLPVKEEVEEIENTAVA